MSKFILYDHLMKTKINDVLTKGLLAGYAGGKITDVSRGGFSGKASHVEISQDEIYHDEWFVPTHNGGGQELAHVGEEKFTRLYAGGIPSKDQLDSMGITPHDVSKYLIQKISELKDKTRLFEDCNPDPDKLWQYSYVITGTYPETEVTTAVESITYSDVVVHIHAFILCPLK